MSSLTQMPRVVVLIVNWNGWQDTVECLRSLCRLDYQNFDVIVIDNGSTNESVKRIRHFFPKTEVIELKRNVGFAAANNRGLGIALEAGFDYAWLLNNDTIVHPHALSALVDRASRDPAIGMCGSTLLKMGTNEVQARGGSEYNWLLGIGRHIGEGEQFGAAFDVEEVERRMKYVVGASMLVSREFVQTVGLMNENYFLYFEEIDWCIRGRGQFALGFAPGSIVEHREGSSIGTSRSGRGHRQRVRSEFFLLRARLLFSREYAPWTLPTVVLGAVGIAGFRLLRGQPRRCQALLEAIWLLALGRRPDLEWSPGE